MYKLTNNSQAPLSFKVKGGGYANLKPNESREITPPEPYTPERIKQLEKAKVKVEKVSK